MRACAKRCMLVRIHAHTAQTQWLRNLCARTFGALRLQVCRNPGPPPRGGGGLVNRVGRREEDAMLKQTAIAFALLVAIGLWAAPTPAHADAGDSDSGKNHAEHAEHGKAHKHRCAYCAAVDTVADAVRCDQCRDAKEQCAKCKKLAATIRKTAVCRQCAGGKKCKACEALSEKIEHAKCKFCAAKKLMAEHVACCTKCAAKDQSARAKCKGCQKVRAALEHVRCPQCDAGK